MNADEQNTLQKISFNTIKISPKISRVMYITMISIALIIILIFLFYSHTYLLFAHNKSPKLTKFNNNLEMLNTAQTMRRNVYDVFTLPTVQNQGKVLHKLKSANGLGYLGSDIIEFAYFEKHKILHPNLLVFNIKKHFLLQEVNEIFDIDDYQQTHFFVIELKNYGFIVEIKKQVVTMMPFIALQLNLDYSDISYSKVEKIMPNNKFEFLDMMK
ncbi:hypothetical protein AB837_00051 [bacterium AB1]|nr:hypothetical protein AB837_00051 [bacterium AB1]